MTTREAEIAADREVRDFWKSAYFAAIRNGTPHEQAVEFAEKATVEFLERFGCQLEESREP